MRCTQPRPRASTPLRAAEATPRAPLTCWRPTRPIQTRYPRLMALGWKRILRDPPPSASRFTRRDEPPLHQVSGSSAGLSLSRQNSYSPARGRARASSPRPRVARAGRYDSGVGGKGSHPQRVELGLPVHHVGNGGRSRPPRHCTAPRQSDRVSEALLRTQPTGRAAAMTRYLQSTGVPTAGIARRERFLRTQPTCRTSGHRLCRGSVVGSIRLTGERESYD
jgi:hypothetical protein